MFSVGARGVELEVGITQCWGEVSEAQGGWCSWVRCMNTAILQWGERKEAPFLVIAIDQIKGGRLGDKVGIITKGLKEHGKPEDERCVKGSLTFAVAAVCGGHSYGGAGIP